MHWLDLVQKLLSAAAALIAIGKGYPAFRQWLRDRNIARGELWAGTGSSFKQWVGDNQQNFWSKIQQLLYGLAVVETVLLVVLLLLAGAAFFMKNYSPDMAAVDFIALNKKLMAGVTVGGLAIKGFWHYAVRFARL